MDKKMMTVILACIIVLGAIGGYMAYGSYKEEMFADSYKLQYEYATKASIIDEQTFNLIYNATYENETDFQSVKEKILKNLDEELTYENKSLYYREQMVQYAPSELYKKYAEIMVKLMKGYIEYLEVTREMVSISQYPSENTNMTRRAELEKKQGELVKANNELLVERNNMILDNSQLENYLKKLQNETANNTKNQFSLV